jgi:hypothetical protein
MRKMRREKIAPVLSREPFFFGNTAAAAQELFPATVSCSFAYASICRLIKRGGICRPAVLEHNVASGIHVDAQFLLADGRVMPIWIIVVQQTCRSTHPVICVTSGLMSQELT